MNNIKELEKALENCRSKLKACKARIYDMEHAKDHIPTEADLKAEITELKDRLMAVIAQKDNFRRMK